MNEKFRDSAIYLEVHWSWNLSSDNNLRVLCSLAAMAKHNFSSGGKSCDYPDSMQSGTTKNICLNQFCTSFVG